jgi:hypothetical protein
MPTTGPTEDVAARHVADIVKSGDGAEIGRQLSNEFLDLQKSGQNTRDFLNKVSADNASDRRTNSQLPGLEITTDASGNVQADLTKPDAFWGNFDRSKQEVFADVKSGTESLPMYPDGKPYLISGSESAIAENHSSVWASGNANVIAASGSRVNIMDKSTATAENGSTVIAWNHSIINAEKGSQALPMDSSHVNADAGSNVIVPYKNGTFQVYGPTMSHESNVTVTEQPGANVIRQTPNGYVKD